MLERASSGYAVYHLPAFRFRYNEENVIREPRSTAMYAKGSIKPFQFISNMVAEVRCQIRERVQFSEATGQISKEDTGRGSSNLCV
jgi:hypothetical protein